MKFKLLTLRGYLSILFFVYSTQFSTGAVFVQFYLIFIDTLLALHYQQQALRPLNNEFLLVLLKSMVGDIGVHGATETDIPHITAIQITTMRLKCFDNFDGSHFRKSHSLNFQENTPVINRYKYIPDAA